jgi:hypothetical protein
MRLIALIVIFAMLCVLDAGITIYLYNEFPGGRELNPYVTPSSWGGLLLAPVKFSVYAFFVFCLGLAERRPKQIWVNDSWTSNFAILAYIPIFMIFSKLLAITNNLMPVLGISTPISYVLMYMRFLPWDEDLNYSLFWSTMFFLLAPPGMWVVKRLYYYPAAPTNAISTR